MRIHAMASLILVAACAPPPPIQPPAPRSGTVVHASFAKAWAAAIAMVAESNVPLERLDKENGLIISKAVSLEPNDTLADCGTSRLFKPRPTEATWTLLVTGDSVQSFVHLSVAYVRVGSPRGVLEHAAGGTVTESCSTLGTAENSIEQMLRARAENGTR